MKGLILIKAVTQSSCEEDVALNDLEATKVEVGLLTSEK